MSREGKYGAEYLQGSEVLLPQRLELLADFVADISSTCKCRKRKICAEKARLCLIESPTENNWVLLPLFFLFLPGKMIVWGTAWSVFRPRVVLPSPGAAWE